MMKIAVLQLDIAWHDEYENIERVRSMISDGEAADLYLLPEMWSSGFTIEAAEVAQTEEASPSLAFMLQTARERDCAVVGSLVIKAEDGTFRNRLYFVTSEGIVARYDKRHLFRIGGETKRYTAGSERVTVEWRGVRFLLQICYDIRFPLFARNRLRDGQPEYDVVIYVASFPAVRMAAWRVLAAARAIENQAYCVAVNRTGEDAYCHYEGGSVVFDAAGDVVTECGAEQQIAVVQLDIEALQEYRRRFPTLRDGDDFELYIK
ncbi:MAG: nitrilase family protein [Alistipes sp.]|nr:nitrilase family protein [Alistipes sp.]